MTEKCVMYSAKNKQGLNSRGKKGFPVILNLKKKTYIKDLCLVYKYKRAEWKVPVIDEIKQNKSPLLVGQGPLSRIYGVGL